MRAKGLIRLDVDPERLAMMIFTAMQGGLLVMQAKDSIEPLEAALDGALAALGSYRPKTE